MTASGLAPRTIAIRLNPVTLVRLLTAGAALLVFLGAWTIALRFGFGHDEVYGFVPKFDLDREGNVPTWYSSVLLLLAAALLGMTAVGRRAAGDRFARHWAGLAVIFALLSMDETASLHGLPSRPIRAAIELPGFLYYAWVVPAGIAVAVFAAVYARFTWCLPPRTRALFIAAGSVYVVGALGGEIASSAYRTAHQIDGAYAAIALLEEAFELGGVLLFLFAVADYLARHHGVVRLTVGETPLEPAIKPVLRGSPAVAPEAPVAPDEPRRDVVAS